VPAGIFPFWILHCLLLYLLFCLLPFLEGYYCLRGSCSLKQTSVANITQDQSQHRQAYLIQSLLLFELSLLARGFEPGDMDCPSPIYNLQPGQSPVDRGTRQHQHRHQHQHQYQYQYQQSPYTAKRLGSSPSASPDTFGDDFFFCDPCPSSVENWTESSPDSVLSNWGLGSSHESTLSPLFSPQRVPFSGPLPDADHHRYHLPQDSADVSCSTTTTTRPAKDSIKVEQHSHLETSFEPFIDWTYDGDFNISYNFETHYPPSSSPEIPATPSPQYETLTPTKTDTKSTVSPILSPPGFSKPSPITTVKAEPQPDRARSRSSSSVSAPLDTSDLPYSKLIYLALLSAKDRKLPLQGIYRWFELNTTKGKEGSKGWQNSIRHNLSMNAV